MITQVSDRIYIADLEGCGHDETKAYVHACKSPCHQHAVNYSGSLPSDHPHYLFKRVENHLYLNMIDPPKPLFKMEIFSVALPFIAAHAKERDVIIHCNQGLSRSPSLAMLHLFAMHDYETALRLFSNLFPAYQPGLGIETFLRDNWGSF